MVVDGARGGLAASGGPAAGIAGKDNQPVTLVTQADARAYAQWLGRDLPTEDEWEFAAKAGQGRRRPGNRAETPDGTPTANYWQGVFPVLNTSQDGFDGLAPVGCYAANAWGCTDMIANAWNELPTRTPGRAPVARQRRRRRWRLPLRQRRDARTAVIKGGSFLCAPDFCVRYRASARRACRARPAHLAHRLPYSTARWLTAGGATSSRLDSR